VHHPRSVLDHHRSRLTSAGRAWAQRQVFNPTGCLALPVGLSALEVQQIDLHAGFQQLLDGRTLASLDCEGNRAAGIDPFTELLPAQSRVVDLESSSTLPWDRRRQRSIFDWPDPVRQNHGYLTNCSILDLGDYSSLQYAAFDFVVALPCHLSKFRAVVFELPAPV
jgi:hypothetical protein